jgi:hypothetical protein
MAKLIERTHQSKNCYCLKEAYIGGGTDGREPGENHEKLSLLFYLMMVGIAHAQMSTSVIPGQVQATRLPVTPLPEFMRFRGRRPSAAPGATQPAICSNMLVKIGATIRGANSVPRRCANQQLATRTRKGRLAAAPENRKGKSTEQRDGDGVSQWMSDRCANVHLSG